MFQPSIFKFKKSLFIGVFFLIVSGFFGLNLILSIVNFDETLQDYENNNFTGPYVQMYYETIFVHILIIVVFLVLGLCLIRNYKNPKIQ